MFSWFNSAMADAIDRVTLEHCKQTSSKGELDQLAQLFNQSYLEHLHSQMVKGVNGANGSRTVLHIKLGWIDKIPLAKQKTKKKKTELGDAILFAIEDTMTFNGKSNVVQSARAVILQAKVTQDYGQLLKPKVPVAPMRDSTKDEYELLSKWPQFDLFKASRSGDALLTEVELNAMGATPPPYGWYLAAPRIKNTAKSALAVWPSWWMVGPPIDGHGCCVSFGSFLRAFLCGTQITIANGSLAAGASFSCPSYPPPPSIKPNWDGLCTQIIKLVEESYVPQHIFISNVKRMFNVNNIYLQRGPISHILFRYMGLGKRMFRGSWSNAYSQFSGRIFNAKSSPLLPQRPGRRRNNRKIPVLIFRSTIVEGEG